MIWDVIPSLSTLHTKGAALHEMNKTKLNRRNSSAVAMDVSEILDTGASSNA